MNSISRQPLEAESVFGIDHWSQAGKIAAANAELATSHQLKVSCISDLGGLAELETEWKSLETRLADSQLLFQSYDWCSAWAKTFLGEHSPFSLKVMVARRGEKTVAILPVMTERKNGLTILRWLSEPFGQYGGTLLAPGEDGPATATALYDACTAHNEIDLIHLRHIRENSFAWMFAETHLNPSGYRETAPFMDMSAFADDAAYQGRYTKTQRRRRRRIANAIEQLGPVSFSKHIGGKNFGSICARAIGNKNTWIAERGLHTVALRCPKLCAFLQRLSESSDSAITTVLTETRAGDRAISHELGLRYNNRHCAFITAHDPELTNLSPARLHMDGSQRLALADGMETFDLMVPGDAYKASWSSGAINVADFARPLTLRGHLYHLAYIRSLRPLLRATYRHVPGTLRQKAMSAVKTVMRK